MNKTNDLFNPYPGLRSFEMNENDLFFGRDEQIDELLHRFSNHRFLAVLGTSGSGKSSLVRAGLLPALYGGFIVGGNSSWRVSIFRPGSNPIGNMAIEMNKQNLLGLSSTSEGQNISDIQTAIIEATLRRSEIGIVEAIKQAKISNNDNILFVIDQFEELFRFKETSQSENEQDDAAAFVKLLLSAIKQKIFHIYIVITMRSDYLGDCAQFRDLPEVINESLYLIPRMTRDQLQEAICGPAAVGGGKITPRLVQKLLNEVGDNPDQLPILQHALMRTWDYWQANKQDDETLDLNYYEKIGGMVEALSVHADQVFDELVKGHPQDIAKRKQQLAEKLFRCLTIRGSDNREIRRPAKLNEICAITDAQEDELISLINIFRQKNCSFLAPPSSISLNSDTLIDISHESLIRQWKRLREWVVQETEDCSMYARIIEAAQRYEKQKGELWYGTDLKLALDWWEKCKFPEAWARRCQMKYELKNALSFLHKSKKKQDENEAKAKERKKLELRQTRIFALVLGLVFLLVIGGGIYAIVGILHLDNNLFDQFLIHADNRKPDKRLLVIEIDDESIRKLGNPLPRDYYVKLIKKLSLFGAKTIAFDLIFINERLPDSDSRLAFVTDSTGHVIHCFVFSNDEPDSTLSQDTRYEKYSIEVNDETDLNLISAWNVTLPGKRFIDSFNLAGYANAGCDYDGRLRRFPLFIEFNDMLYPGLGVTALLDYYSATREAIKIEKTFWGRQAIIETPTEIIKIPINSKGEVLLNFYGKFDVFEPKSLHEIVNLLDVFQPKDSSKISLPLFDEKIVLVGNTETGMDIRITPFSKKFPGVGIHATFISNILKGDLIIEASQRINTIFSLLLVSFLIFIFIYYLKFSKSIWTFLVPSIIIVVGFNLTAYFIFFKLFKVWLKVLQINGICCSLFLFILFYELVIKSIIKLNVKINQL